MLWSHISNEKRGNWNCKIENEYEEITSACKRKPEERDDQPTEEQASLKLGGSIPYTRRTTKF